MRNRRTLLILALALLAGGVVGGIVVAQDGPDSEKSLDPVQGRFKTVNNASIVAAAWDGVGTQFTARNSRVGPEIARSMTMYVTASKQTLSVDEQNWQKYE